MGKASTWSAHIGENRLILSAGKKLGYQLKQFPTTQQAWKLGGVLNTQ